MSLAIKKRSWEEHVTEWMGLSSSFSGHDTICCHRLTSDNLKTAMDKHDVLTVEQKEKDPNISECIYVGGCNHLLENEKQISKDVDENDNLDMNGHYISPEVESVVHYPGEGYYDSCKINSKMLCLDGPVSESDVLLQDNLSNESPKHENRGADNILDYRKTQNVEATEGEHVDSTKEINQDNLHILSFTSGIDAPVETIYRSTDVAEIGMPGEQLLKSALIAQKRRKSDVSKDGHGKNICDVLDDSLCGKCVDVCCQLMSETCPKGCLNTSHMCSHTSCKENGIYNNKLTDLSDAKKEDKQSASSKDAAQSLEPKDKIPTCGIAYEQVRLRRKKKLKESRDRSKLDSMVLLIMKLDQLDQDIENALSTGQSPSWTPTLKQRDIPIEQQEPISS
ncbi:rho GTPase-activating protein 7-like [Bombina bombina]|uniref:rho GTPase-activating protein 7-like n=1 Tax=Bombina bombina TaxID=8345 RepID=UPI00235B0B3F|nr:rho GTPase-activating protein 7-like [Bombina bombina]